MIRFTKSKNIIMGVVLLVIVFTTGCGIAPISVRYTPTGAGQRIVTGAPKVKLQIEDVREKKVFFRTILGDNDDEGKNGILRLTRSPKEVFEEGFTEALQLAGCQVREDAEIVYEVRIKRFLAISRENAINLLDSDIMLEVLIKRSEELLARKTIFERDTEKQAFGQVWQHVIPPLLSRSLSRAIEKAIQDKDLIAALGANRAVAAKTPDQQVTALPRQKYTLPRKLLRDFTRKVRSSETKQQTASKTTSAVSRSRAYTRTPDSDFVIRVIRGLPHRFLEGDVKGLWLSSVPLKLDVFAFPKGFSQKFSVFKNWVMNETNPGYYLGKTPLLAKLKKGTYEILFVHPPIKDENYRPRYRSRYDETLRGQVRQELYPFIAPRKPALYAVEGEYYWAQTMEVSADDNLSTAIALFQREDQTVSDVLSGLPAEESFNFCSADSLRDPNKLFDASFALTDEEASQAEQMLKRAGIWAKKYSDHQTLTIEVKPNNVDEFRGTSLVSGKEMDRLERMRVTVLPKPEPIPIQTPKLPVADVPATRSEPLTRSNLPEVQPLDFKPSQKTPTLDVPTDKTNTARSEPASHSEPDANSKGTLALVERAEFLSKQGRDDAALALFEQVLESTKDADLRARALIGIGNFLSSDGRSDEAEDYYSQAGDLAKAPDVKARVLLAQVGHLGEKGKYREAREKVEKAQSLATSPETNALALVTSAALCVGEGKVEEGRRQFVQARTHLEAAFQIMDKPLEKAQLKGVIATIFIAQGQHKEAIAELREASRLTKDANFTSAAFLGIGACFMMQRNWLEAHKAMQQALTLAPDEDTKSMALIGMGELAQRRGDRKGALAKYEEALRVGGSQNQQSYAFFKRGIALFSFGRVEEARDSFEKVVTLTKSKNRRARALNNLGFILKRQGNLGEAKAKFEEALVHVTRPSIRKQILQNLKDMK